MRSVLVGRRRNGPLGIFGQTVAIFAAADEAYGRGNDSQNGVDQKALSMPIKKPASERPKELLRLKLQDATIVATKGEKHANTPILCLITCGNPIIGLQFPHVCAGHTCHPFPFPDGCRCRADRYATRGSGNIYARRSPYGHPNDRSYSQYAASDTDLRQCELPLGSGRGL